MAKEPKKTRGLERHIEPFASEEEREEARDNLRKWADKLGQWDALLRIKAAKRDAN